MAATLFHGSSRPRIILRKGYLDEDQLQGLFSRLGIDVTFTLPTSHTFMEVAASIEETATKAGLLMMKALLDDEIEQFAGERYRHEPSRQAVRWGSEDSHVIHAGRKVAMKKPRVRSVDGHEEISLARWNFSRILENGTIGSGQNITASVLSGL
jgi:hypothetical protein